MPNKLQDFITAGGSRNYGQPWQSYTPIIIPATNPFLIGNGQALGRYHFPDIYTCEVGIDILIGNTTILGTGAYAITLPRQAANYIKQYMGGWILDSGAGYFVQSGYIEAAASVISPMTADGASTAPLSNTVPMTWAANDRLLLLGLYEIEPLTSTLNDPPTGPTPEPVTPGVGECWLVYDTSDTPALPSAWSPGDLLISWSASGTNVAPTLPAGYTLINEIDGVLGGSIRCGYRILQAGDVAQQWLGGGPSMNAIYTNVNPLNPVGSSSTYTNPAGTPWNVSGLALQNLSGNSLVICTGWNSNGAPGGKGADFSAYGITNRTSGLGLPCYTAAAITGYMGDSNGGSSGFGGGLDAIGGAPVGRAVTIELLPAP